MVIPRLRPLHRRAARNCSLLPGGSVAATLKRGKETEIELRAGACRAHNDALGRRTARCLSSCGIRKISGKIRERPSSAPPLFFKSPSGGLPGAKEFLDCRHGRALSRRRASFVRAVHPRSPACRPAQRDRGPTGSRLAPIGTRRSPSRGMGIRLARLSDGPAAIGHAPVQRAALRQLEDCAPTARVARQP